MISLDLLREPIILRIQPIAIEQRDDRDRIDETWVGPVRHWPWPTRAITRTVPIDLRAPQRQLEQRKRALAIEQEALAPLAAAVARWDTGPATAVSQLLAGLPPDIRQIVERALGSADPTRRDSWAGALDRLADRYWVEPWLDEYILYYERLVRQSTLRGLQHYLLAWPGPDVTPEYLATMTSRGFGTPVQVTSSFPALIAGPDEYDERATHLEPRYPDLPYIAMLVAYRLTPEQEWTVETLRCIFDLNLDIDLCVDVETRPRWWQQYQADQEEALRQGDVVQMQVNRDRRALKKLAGAGAIQEMLEAQQQLHSMRIVLALRAESPGELDEQVSLLQQSCSNWMSLARPAGGQLALTRFFSVTPARQVDAWAPTLVEPSHGVAVTLPWALRRLDRTDGILWGFSGPAPIHFHPTRDSRGEKAPGHTVVAGQTNSGKTTAASAWALRMLAMLDAQIVMFEPQGHGARFIRACGRGGRRYLLGMNEGMNVLDAAVGRDEEERPPTVAEQAQYVLNQLSILLGTHVPTPTGAPAFQPRIWQPIESGLIELALEQIYGDWTSDLERMSPDKAPVLADLSDALRSIEVDFARTAALRDQLLDEIYITLVRGPKGRVYNRRTTVDWDFVHDAVAYDFTHIVDGPAKMLVIAKALGAVNTYVRSQRRDRQRLFVNVWDELSLTMKAAPPLASWAEMATRSWRTFYAMLMALDQDGPTWLTEGPLRVMFDQSALKVMFYQSQKQAQRLGEAVDGLLADHVRHMSLQQQGDFMLSWKIYEGLQTNDVFVGRLELTPGEWAVLHGM